MFQRKQRRFRRRSNPRKHLHRSNGSEQAIHHSFSNGRGRGNFKPQQSPEKLLERYNTLAKEALSSGDKILSENYLQHADHFARIIEMKNLNQNQNNNQNQNTEKLKSPEETSSNSVETNQNKIIQEKK